MKPQKMDLAEEDYKLNLRSKILTSSLENSHGGRRYLPYVFTEQGVLMLVLSAKIQ